MMLWGLIIFLEGGGLFSPPHLVACGILVSQLGTEPWAWAVKVQSLPLDHQRSPISLNNVNMKMAKFRTYTTDSAPKIVKAVRSLIYIEVATFFKALELKSVPCTSDLELLSIRKLKQKTHCL